MNECPKCGTSAHVVKEIEYFQQEIREIYRCMKCGWKDGETIREELKRKYKEEKIKKEGEVKDEDNQGISEKV